MKTVLSRVEFGCDTRGDNRCLVAAVVPGHHVELAHSESGWLMLWTFSNGSNWENATR